MRLAAPQLLIDINGLDALAGIRFDGRVVRIGALTRHRALERSPLVAQHLPLVHRAMPHVAHAAIRNRGTFGGSIAYADPAAELPACCVALDAQFVLASRRGERRVAARDFFRGLYETALQPDEVLVAGEFPARAAGERAAFGELARRHGDFAIVGLAAHARGADRVLSALRLVFFGVGAQPVMATAAAAELEGRPHSAETVARARAALAQDLDPVDDIHHSAATRMQLARVLLERVLDELTGGQSPDRRP
jgi:carbon-monoxide dehydrogenase medium subunit